MLVAPACFCESAESYPEVALPLILQAQSSSSALEFNYPRQGLIGINWGEVTKMDIHSTVIAPSGIPEINEQIRGYRGKLKGEQYLWEIRLYPPKHQPPPDKADNGWTGDGATDGGQVRR